MSLMFSGRVAAMPSVVSGVGIPLDRERTQQMLRAVASVGEAAAPPSLVSRPVSRTRDPRTFLANLAATAAHASREVDDLRAQAQAAYRAGNVVLAVALAQQAGRLASSERCSVPSVLAFRPTPLRDELVLNINAAPGNYTRVVTPATFAVLSGIGREATV